MHLLWLQSAARTPPPRTPPILWSERQRISRNNRSLMYLCPTFSLLWSHLCARVPLHSVQWEWTCTKSHTSGFPGGRSVRWGWWENSPTAHCCPRSTAVYILWKTRGSHGTLLAFPRMFALCAGWVLRTVYLQKKIIALQDTESWQGEVLWRHIDYEIFRLHQMLQWWERWRV